MLEELTALAAVGGAAVVQAAGTDVWHGVRRRVAVLVGHGDTAREDVELRRLDETGTVLGPDAAGDRAVERMRQESLWQGRFEALLDGLDPSGQERAAGRLRELAAFVAARAGDTAERTGDATADAGGTAVSGVRRSGTAAAGSARAVDTGNAEADGPGSTAVSGVQIQQTRAPHCSG
ncbi:hypothetical protein ABCR94_13495 [Streptomyces sp. 21So2-11]|uniref:hypothetical protein n=1 Tax=Streptomyces sp. 21So2-11 TaxID=3144408 RepID=UPI00321B17E7